MANCSSTARLISTLAVFLCATLCRQAAAEDSLESFFARNESNARVLSLPLTATWRNVELRATTQRLTAVTGVTVLLDVRVDPTLPVDLEATEQPLFSVVGELAAAHDLVAQPIDRFVYISTSSRVAKMRLMFARHRRLLHEAKQSPDIRPVAAGLSNESVRDWPRLATPASVISDIANEIGLMVEGLEAVPHDLLSQQDLPRMSRGDQLTLLLAQYGLAWSINSPGRIALHPIPDEATIDRDYTRPENETAAFLQAVKTLPADAYSRNGDTLTVRGTIAAHEQFAIAAKLISGSARGVRAVPDRVANSNRRFTLRVQQQPAGPVLQQLAAKLNAKIDAAQVAEAKLNERISFEVEQATLAELLSAVGDAAGLSVTNRGGTWQVRDK